MMFNSGQTAGFSCWNECFGTFVLKKLGDHILPLKSLSQWFSQPIYLCLFNVLILYIIVGTDDHVANVEMNPTVAAAQSLTVSQFDLNVEFSVAIGKEFVPILRTRSNLSASVKDWSCKVFSYKMILSFI